MTILELTFKKFQLKKNTAYVFSFLFTYFSNLFLESFMKKRNRKQKTSGYTKCRQQLKESQKQVLNYL